MIVKPTTTRNLMQELFYEHSMSDGEKRNSSTKWQVAKTIKIFIHFIEIHDFINIIPASLTVSQRTENAVVFARGLTTISYVPLNFIPPAL